MDAGKEELLGLAVHIVALRKKVASLPLVRELAALEADFERRSGKPLTAAVKVEAPRTNTPKGQGRQLAPPPQPGTFRGKVEVVFRTAPGSLTWAQAAKILGVDPKKMRSTMSYLLEKKRIKRVDRGEYVWSGEVAGNGLSPNASEARV